jgi:hypothetical protein
MWLWVLLGGLVLVAVGAVVVALLALRALGVGLF